MRSSLKKDFIRDELTSGEMLSMMGIQESHYSMRYKMVREKSHNNVLSSLNQNGRGSNGLKARGVSQCHWV